MSASTARRPRRAPERSAPPAATANAALRGVSTRPPDLSIGPTAEVLRRLELTITRRLDGLLQGDHRGLVPAHGSELGETRGYQPGDDVRRIDWNVTSRTRHAHVRDTIADRELETWVLADFSASLGFGTAECEKRDLAVAAAVAVGHLTARTGNRIGAMALEGRDITTTPTGAGRLHVQALLHRLVLAARTEHDGAPDLAVALRRLTLTMRRRGLAVVITDFLCPLGWEQPLRALAARNDVLVVEVVDPRELALPDVGIIEVFDPETGDRREVDTRKRHIRDDFAVAARTQRAEIAQAVRATGADHLVLSTDSDWLLDLVRFVSSRRERMDALTRTRT
jgi:uncharacterized protein (DUF58 family)